MPSAVINGATIAYDDIGKGAPILLVHGIFVSKAQWANQVSALKRSHRVIAIDLRGHGDSSVATEGYSVALLAHDIAALLDQLGIDRAVCCGHSFGGLVAQELALSHPDRVRGLVLAETIYGVVSTPWEASLTAMWSETLQHFDPRALMDVFATYLGCLSPEGMSRITAQAGRHVIDERSARLILEASLRFDSRWRLHRIDCPTLLVIGQIPHLPLVTFHAIEMFWRIPKARYAVIPAAGHMVHWDNIEEFNRVLMDFLKAL